MRAAIKMRYAVSVYKPVCKGSCTEDSLRTPNTNVTNQSFSANIRGGSFSYPRQSTFVVFPAATLYVYA